MFPYFVLFEQTHYTYPLIGLAGLFIAVSVAYIRAKRVGISYFDMTLSIVFLGLGIVVGGAVFHALVQSPVLWSYRTYFFDNPLLFLRAAFGGLVFYGGLVGALATMPLYAKIIKQDLSTLFALFIPVFPLAHGIMRIGCFMAGCCYGVECDILGVAFIRSLAAPNDVNLLPVQLFESVANFLVFAILWRYTSKSREPLKVFCFYGLSYAVIRFMLEFLRGDEARGFIFIFSVSQFISILVALFCVCGLIFRNPQNKVFYQS